MKNSYGESPREVFEALLAEAVERDREAPMGEQATAMRTQWRERYEAAVKYEDEERAWAEMGDER
jgi:hypothetical protein